MSLSTEFWIGTALAVPLSIIASLLAPRVQSWIDKRGAKASEKRRAEIEEEFREIKSFKSDQSLFYVYLLEAGIRIAFYTALFGLLSGMFFLATQIVASIDLELMKSSIRVFSVFSSAGQFIALIGTLIVFRVAMQAISKIQKYRNYESYAKEVEDILRNG